MIYDDFCYLFNQYDITWHYNEICEIIMPQKKEPKSALFKVILINQAFYILYMNISWVLWL